jgi:hypothetical protein
MLSSSVVMILEKISPSMTHVMQIDTTSSLNSQVQELPNAMLRWNERYKPYTGGLEENATMIGVRIKLLQMIMIRMKTSDIPWENM